MSSYSLNIFIEIPRLSSKLTMFWHNFFAHKTLGGQSINSCVPNFIKKWTHLCSYFSNKKILFIFIIYFSISCSTTKVFYNYADLLILNWTIVILSAGIKYNYSQLMLSGDYLKSSLDFFVYQVQA